MSSKNEKKTIEEHALEQEFAFDKFVKDLEAREENRRQEQERIQQREHNDVNRQRDALNRERLHNRIRWRR